MKRKHFKMNKKNLNEFCLFDFKVDKILKENKNGKKIKDYIISGPFMRADVPTRNNTLYTTEEANKAIRQLRPFVEEGRIRMLVDHPDFISEGGLKNAGAKLLSITDIQEDGYAYYKAKIYNTRVGKDLKAILDEDSKIGVSTRGYGFVKEEKVPGFEGTFSVIYEWELQSIDFVDDPSVIDTESKMHIESNKRSTNYMKTVEEFKAACPELFKQVVENTTKDVKTELEKTLNESRKEVETLKAAQESKNAELEALVESFKKAYPDKFTVIEESKIVAEKEARIEEIEKSLNETKLQYENAQKSLKEKEDAHINSEKESYIEHLKATDPEFFKISTFENCFEHCLTKDEVKTVYENNSKIVKELQEKITNAKPGKTTQTDENSDNEESGKLTESQRKDMESRNRQRIRAGLEEFSEDVYLEKFVKTETK